MSNTTHGTSDYFPWEWTITSLNKNTHKCPTVSSLLGTFAAVNGVVSFLAVVFGYRHVVKKITCGAMGRRGSHSWTFMWIIPVGLQLAANACIAVLLKRSVGYTANFRVDQLMLFLVARPRLSWIVLGAFAFKSQKTKEKATRVKGDLAAQGHYIRAPQGDTRYDPGTPQPITVYSPWVSQQSFASPTPYTSQTTLIAHPNSNTSRSDYQYTPLSNEQGMSKSSQHSDLDHPWRSTFMAQFIAEYILQIMSLYIMGRTAHFATTHDYYEVHLKSYWSIPAAARMMYSGALYYLVAGSVFLIFATLFIIFALIRKKNGFQGTATNGVIFITLLFLLISTWMGSWIFWAGFVQLAGDQYCPPKLVHQGVIWIFFSTIGVILGTGV